MPRSLIALLTDFGLSDHFVGVMKGVMLGIHPTARIVDVTHGLTPFEIPEAGFVLAQTYRYFPKKTVYVVVVDPGVGTARRPLLVEAGGWYFIGPDNGVFSMLYAREKHKVRAITAERYFLKSVSNTFHGRDIFAPCAAHLTKGVAPARFGKLISDYTRLEFGAPVRTGKRMWTGAVLRVDRFGNLITNIPIESFPQLRERPFELRIGTEALRGLSATYADCPHGEAGVVVGSSGCLEVAMNRESAARRLGCGLGSPAELIVY